MNKHLVAAAILAVIFGGFLLYVSMPTLAGTGIELKLMPVDPFDLIRGQYLTLNYEINRHASLPDIPDEAVVYVLLEKGEDEIYHAVSVSQSWPQKSKEQVVIRGIAHKDWIEYGIESFFMERGAQLTQRIEDLTAYVKVLPDGRATVKELRKDHKSIEFEYKEGPLLQL
jgi:uncharacterized membrane-anchored protein